MTELNSIRLPYLAARSDVAEFLVERANLAPISSTVTIYARALSVSTPRFTNRLVKLLAEKGFRQLVVHGAGSRFRKELEDALATNPTITLKKAGESSW